MSDNPLDRLRDLEAELASLKRQRVWIQDGEHVRCYLADAEYPLGTMMWMKASGIATKQGDPVPEGFRLGPSVPAPALTLEPTEDQFDTVVVAVVRAMDDGPDAIVHAAWDCIAPMVLEAAALACDNGPVRPDGLDTAAALAAAIRAMKGGGG